MISEALETLFEKQSDATRLVPLAIDDPRAKHFDKRGEPVAYPLPVPPRRHTVQTIESLAKTIAKYSATTPTDSVWVSLGRAVAVLDDSETSHRCDHVTLPVTPAPYFDVLAKCGKEWMTQKKLIDMLRHDLAGALIDPADTLSVLRNLRFEQNAEQTGNYTNTSAKMGKSVASQVTGEAALPEVVTVEFHPYPAIADEVDVAVIVFCTLFVDSDEAKLKLVPQPGQLEAAQTKATLALRSAVQDAVGVDIPVFVGTP